MHFLGALAYEDSSAAVEPLRITPKKKVVKITIDREQVLVKKAKKEPPAKGKAQIAKPSAPAQTAAKPPTTPPQTAAQPAPATAGTTEPSDADQLKASDRRRARGRAPRRSLERYHHLLAGARANLLRNAIDRIFSVGIDDRMIAAMPDFWKLYYQAVAEKADYRPTDPSILRQNDVDKKAKLLSAFEPDSNEFAQADGVSGLALYHTVLGADGKPKEIVIARPIGFGLDESAVDSIRKASFEPAIKEGKPVPVLLDLVVEFHIYSKRTAVLSKPENASKTDATPLPGPYSLQHP